MGTAQNHPSRHDVQALDDILGVKFPVLDEGFVRVVDYMGSDEAVVQAARVSYGKGTKQVNEDRALIRYLMRHRHSTPFEMCEIKLHVRVPMDCWRQWIRHRTANVNEYSTRYSEAIDAAQKTSPGEWRMQATVNRQGSGSFLEVEVGEALSAEEAQFQQAARACYEDRLKKGVSREQARKDLPLSTYTEAYWKCDLHNLLHFLSLRMDSHAQLEIRQYANTIGNEIVARWCPMSWEAFVEYRLNSIVLHSIEIEILASVLRGDSDKATRLAADHGWLHEGKISREKMEFEDKLSQLGRKAPWKQ